MEEARAVRPYLLIDNQSPRYSWYVEALVPLETIPIPVKTMFILVATILNIVATMILIVLTQQ